MRLEPQRHHRFGRLAAEALLIRQEIILDQLLRQRAAALHHPPGAQIGPERAQDAARIDAVMLIEAPILDEFDAGASSGGTSAGASTRRSSPWIGKTLPITGGSRRNTGRSLPSPCFKRGDGIRVGADRDQLRLAQFVGEAHAARVRHRRYFRAADTGRGPARDRRGDSAGGAAPPPDRPPPPARRRTVRAARRRLARAPTSAGPGTRG